MKWAALTVPHSGDAKEWRKRLVEGLRSATRFGSVTARREASGDHDTWDGGSFCKVRVDRVTQNSEEEFLRLEIYIQQRKKNLQRDQIYSLLSLFATF
jgi:hypothetical protein